MTDEPSALTDAERAELHAFAQLYGHGPQPPGVWRTVPGSGPADSHLAQRLRELRQADRRWFRLHRGQDRFVRPYVDGEFFEMDDAPANIEAVLVIGSVTGARNRIPLIRAGSTAADAPVGWEGLAEDEF